MQEYTEKFIEVQKSLLSTIVADKLETKQDNRGNKISYLSWASAWNIVLKVCPTASYEVLTFGEYQLPYQKSELGYMVWTQITIEGVTKKMWLPVMDFRNEAMLDQPREIQTKNGKIVVAPADMNDINKTIMRCLVKNLAMFGLGLNVYQGEDAPDVAEERQAIPAQREHCEECGKEIRDYGVYTADKIMSVTMQKYGKKLCYNCSVAKKASTKGE